MRSPSSVFFSHRIQHEERRRKRCHFGPLFSAKGFYCVGYTCAVIRTSLCKRVETQTCDVGERSTKHTLREGGCCFASADTLKVSGGRVVVSSSNTWREHGSRFVLASVDTSRESGGKRGGEQVFSTSGEVGCRFPFTPFFIYAWRVEVPVVAEDSGDNRIELAKTTVRSSVCEETSKSHAHCDVTHAMTMTRTGLRAAGRCGRVLHDCSKDFPDSVTMAPRLRTEKKLTDIPIVARSLSRTDESASSTAPIHIPRHNRDDDESHKCSSSTSWLTSFWACSWALGLSCETPAVFWPPGFHTTARELETCTYEALQTPPKFHEKPPREREKRNKNCDGRGKKKREILGSPTLRGSTLRTPPVASPLHFSSVFLVPTLRCPPFGTHPSGQQTHEQCKKTKQKHKQLTKKTQTN